MLDVVIKDSELRKAAAAGMDAFVDTFVNAIKEAIGGELTADNMQLLNSDQITLLGYCILREEVMDGGFIQLIHNGYGGFIYRNPFAKAVREWGLIDLYRIINKSHKYYNTYHEQIEQDCTDEEFMALYEAMPKFDDFDDAFIEGEEQFTRMIAAYIDDHIDRFAIIDEEK
ncbi:DMP19 family protein [Prevotella sp. A2931]|uniref:DMP19 family protein n=1 Tax=Prevotella illustrans TaxID=2800387 RepID=A0ABS3M7J5_9BACT|nr:MULTISPECIES: DMP19 family protein [Prevotella]MBO1364147.1 DMP19 family protein [Prevotella illustrans]PTL24992.1 hypothetical protein C3V39_09675 [Prevotella sp. oral taxon 820]